MQKQVQKESAFLDYQTLHKYRCEYIDQEYGNQGSTGHFPSLLQIITAADSQGVFGDRIGKLKAQGLMQHANEVALDFTQTSALERCILEDYLDESEQD